MNILVTGGGGFQGSHIVEALLSRGHFVRVLTTPSLLSQGNLSSIINNPNLQLIWGSVTDNESVSKSVTDCDVIIHLAAHINVDESIRKPEDHVLVNVIGTLHLLKAAHEQKARMIYGSSCEVYGTDDVESISENHILNPRSPYAASKAAADRLVQSFHLTYGLDTTIVRPFNIFGPRQKSRRQGGAVIPTFVELIHSGQSPRIFGSGKQMRDYLYVDDIVQGYMLVLETSSLNGDVINFGSGEGVSILTLTDDIISSMKSDLKPVFEKPRPGEVNRFVADTRKASALGFKPKISFKEGINRYVDWFTRNHANQEAKA